MVIDRGINGKDNLLLGVYRDGEMVEVGKVSALTGDGPRVSIGDVVTVKVLYASAAGKLYLPVTPHLRTDKSRTDCGYEQIIALQTNKRSIGN